jgi:eukaryotic-like serine/threonine-protein kinase
MDVTGSQELGFAPSRFELLRHLGSGSTGAVFEAFDAARGTRVALKTLTTRSPQSLLSLKNEFRALQDVRHPSLVHLLELVEENGSFYVVMELVEGVDFLTHTRPGSAQLAATLLSETRRTQSEAPPETTEQREPFTGGQLHADRLRAALGQLAEALCALHDSGKVHRDIKPANVLVTSAARLVLVDFGLAEDTAAGPSKLAGRVGTRAFMAPEQAAGQAVTTAADWYSVGVMTYLALAGELPFRGAEVERKKVGTRPPAPQQKTGGASAELWQLALDLLEPDPALRPDGRAVLARLGLSHRTLPAPPLAPFIGRERELARLWQAFRQARHQPATVLVVGDSGLGKSALVREWLAAVAHQSPQALLLSSRCYERELVPYKAFDGIVDCLSQFLRRLSPEDQRRLLPPHASILARIFPVLEGSLSSFAETPSTSDPQELRALAFSALRELLQRIARERSVVLFIDDLQWADADSHLLLADLLQPPDAPALCLVAASRSARDAQDRPILPAERLDHVTELELAPLPFDAARELAAALLGGGAPSTLAGDIAREAGGHPLFLQALSAHAFRTGEVDVRGLRLEDAIFADVQRISAEARLLLELVAVAGAPLSPGVADEATGLPRAVFATSVAALRVARLLRSSPSEARSQLEPYHDRVRETVLARLEPSTRRARHEQLAGALLTASGLDARSALVRHLEGAGRLVEAASQSALAARDAERALAFDQAAELYRSALRLGYADAKERRALELALARALTSAGRAAEAAEAYLVVASSGSSAERLEHRRRAADHLLRSGHLERGNAILSEVLRELGDDLGSQRRSLLTTLWQRALRRVRGLGWTPRREEDIPRDLLRRIDAYHAVGVSLALVDPVRGSAFEARAVRLALEAGDPLRLGPVLVMEAGYNASVGSSGLAVAERLMQEVGRIAELTGDRYIAATLRMMQGFSAYHAGRFAIASESLQRMELEFQDLRGTYFEQAFCHCFRLICLRNEGRWGELQAGYFDWVKAAERRGDRFTEASLRYNLNGIWLARDEPDEARRDLSRISWIPPAAGYHVQHWYEQQARVELDLYEGNAARGLARFREELKALSRSFILRMRLHRCHARWLLGRLLLAESRAPTRISEVEQLAQQLWVEGVGFARVWSLLLRAGAAQRRGQRERAARTLESAIAEAEAAGQQHCRHAAAYFLGDLRSGDEGATSRRTALGWASAQSLRRPERLFRSWVAGFE